MFKNLYPVILSGGIGARLWPLSRQGYPKQFLNLYGDHSLIQQTAMRFPDNKPLIVCNQEHRFMAAAQMQEVGIEAEVLLEPAAKNTAPAAAVAAYYLQQQNPDAVMLICPSDHIIKNVNVFHQSIEQALDAAQHNKLVLLGIKPENPETGYGYIQAGNILTNQVCTVKQFVEKPDKKTAESYVESGDYYWNAGIFLFPVKKYLEELEQHHPNMAKLCQRSVEQRQKDLDFIRLAKEPFEQIQGDSIDYAVLEKTKDAAVVSVNGMGWSDIGSWQALWGIESKDNNGNILKGNVVSEDTKNCYIQTHDKQLVAALGVENLTVVATKDAILIIDSNRSQETKTLVQKLDKQPETQQHTKQHTRVYRPWGTYESIDEGGRYQVKRITVNPGQKLSVQKHFHRAEHWTVVNGTALVHRDDQELMLTENESVYLPIGSVHSLENPGKIPLTIIEVQVGAYVGEDDIIRLSDNYGR